MRWDTLKRHHKKSELTGVARNGVQISVVVRTPKKRRLMVETLTAKSEDAARDLCESLLTHVGNRLEEVDLTVAGLLAERDPAQGDAVVAAWNQGVLTPSQFLTQFADCMTLELAIEQRAALKILLERLFGQKKFRSAEHAAAWLTGPRDPSDVRSGSKADHGALLLSAGRRLPHTEEPPELADDLEAMEELLPRVPDSNLAGPIRITSLPGELDAGALSELGSFGAGLESALLELRSARLTEAESRFVAFRTVGGLTAAEAGQRLGLSAADAAVAWSRIADKLVRELPEQGIVARGASQIVTFALAETVLLERLLQSPALLGSLSWRDFEKALAITLERIGFEIELRRGTKDGGIDILAIKRAETFGVHRYLVQAKRYSQRVGVSVVRELLFLHSHHRVTKSCLASTSSFTKGAWKLGKEYEWQLGLRDRDRLLEWIRAAVQR